MNTVDLEALSKESGYKLALCPFYKDGRPFAMHGDEVRQGDFLKAPLWGMTLRATGKMRFRWNEQNPVRDKFMAELSEKNGGKKIVPVELIHSKTVFCAESGDETAGKKGDGIITRNPALIPTVTAADCVPICFYDSKNGAFGIVHSGWKGTGIVREAIALMERNYGSRPEDILAAVGAHIRECCYFVDSERAEYFAVNFGENCVRRVAPKVRDENGNGNKDVGATFALSLEQANISLLRAAGILEGNIVLSKNCTCCSERFGSFRREAAFSDAADKSRAFTVQAAFVIAPARTFA